MKILVVEDEPETGNYLQHGLTEAGFTVDVACAGSDAVRVATSDDYDLIVLDVMLPGCDAWSVPRALREAGKVVPVLYVTARGRGEDQVGPNISANDYVVKSFAFCDILSRVCARCCADARRWSPTCSGWPTSSSTCTAEA